MRTLLIIALILFSTAFSFSTGNAGEIPKEILSHCQEKWQTNYKMIQYCVEGQVESLNALAASQAQIPKEILSHCQEKWQTNYKMIQYCVEGQVKAKAALGR